MSDGPRYFAGPVPPDAVELRVVGCLIEKQRATPDHYPLSVNSLRNACNQATNRDPVVEFDEQTVIDALERLARRGWVRFASGAGSRARKYRHILDDALTLDPAESALLCVLMLRGAQTPGELKQRSERLHPFEDLQAVDAVLERLVERELVAALKRRPGQKELRYVQLLGGEADEAEGAGEALLAFSSASGSNGQVAERIDALEAQVAELREQLESLRADLGA